MDYGLYFYAWNSELKGLNKHDFMIPIILTLHFQCCLFLIYLAHRHFQHDPIHCNWFAVFGNDPPSSDHNPDHTLVYCSQLFQQSGIFSAGQNWLCLNNKKKQYYSKIVCWNLNLTWIKIRFIHSIFLHFHYKLNIRKKKSGKI